MKYTIEHIANELNLEENKILNCYHFGSYVYETNNINSDYDFIIVYENSNNEIYDINIINNVHNLTNEQADGVWNKSENIQATLYSKEQFIKYNHKINILECLFLPDKYKIKETIDFLFYFILNIDLLRRNISAVCENSWVKCKKKMTVEYNNDRTNTQEYYNHIGKKSLFHSLRIGLYGIQIAKYGKIIDYINLNNKYTTMSLWDEINQLNTWEKLKNKYQPIANDIRTQFRLLAPLNTL